MKTLIFLTLALPAVAQTSTDYALTSTVFDDTGGAQSSADYAQHATLGGMHGISSNAATDIVRAGYAGRLYEAVSLQLSPMDAIMDEGTSRQLSATLMLDDATTLALSPNEVGWKVITGPIASILASGLATAAFVYADGNARIGGSYGAMSELLFLNVRNTGDDDFGIYASDGLPDIWQVGWFGENNGAGRADRDPDGDGQDNAFEFLSGYSPLDGTAFFKTRALAWEDGIFQLELSRIQPGTGYDIFSSPDLIEWTLEKKLVPSALAEPFVQPLPSEVPAAFFRVQLYKVP